MTGKICGSRKSGSNKTIVESTALHIGGALVEVEFRTVFQTLTPPIAALVLFLPLLGVPYRVKSRRGQIEGTFLSLNPNGLYVYRVTRFITDQRSPNHAGDNTSYFHSIDVHFDAASEPCPPQFFDAGFHVR